MRKIGVRRRLSTMLLGATLAVATCLPMSASADARGPARHQDYSAEHGSDPVESLRVLPEVLGEASESEDEAISVPPADDTESGGVLVGADGLPLKVAANGVAPSRGGAQVSASAVAISGRVLEGLVNAGWAAIGVAIGEFIKAFVH